MQKWSSSYPLTLNFRLFARLLSADTLSTSPSQEALIRASCRLSVPWISGRLDVELEEKPWHWSRRSLRHRAPSRRPVQPRLLLATVDACEVEPGRAELGDRLWSQKTEIAWLNVGSMVAAGLLRRDEGGEGLARHMAVQAMPRPTPAREKETERRFL